jgi:hypothetical protein
MSEWRVQARCRTCLDMRLPASVNRPRTRALSCSCFSTRAAWLVFDRASFDWHGLTELIVLCMTLFIVRSEHRDTQPIHAKLDEILRAQGAATRELIDLDHREPEDIEKHREQARAEHGHAP